MAKRKPTPDRIICPCLRVTESEVRAAVRSHRLASVADITCFTEAGDGCTACHDDLAKVITEEAEREESSSTPSRAPSPVARTGSCSTRSL